MRKFSLILLVLLSCITVTKAQVSLGAGVAHNYLFAGYNNFGFEIKGDWAPHNDYAAFTACVSYFLPGSKFGTSRVEALSNIVRPEYLDVPYKSTISLIHGSIGYRGYFFGELDAVFNVYGALALGLIFVPENYEVLGGLDVSNYYITPGRSAILNSTFAAQVGLEKELVKNVYFTLETGLVFPAEEQPDIAISVRTSTGIRVNI